MDVPTAPHDASLNARNDDARETVEVCSHAHARLIALDPERYSSAVSRFLQLPNALDGADHATWRSLVDRHLDAAIVRRLEPQLRVVARALVASITGGALCDAVELGERFAAQAQCVWLGWDAHTECDLIDWMHAHRRANAAGDDDDRSRVAARFDEIVAREVGRRRSEGGGGAAEPQDATSQLMHERVDGAPLRDEQLVSILRNWTAGDLSTLAFSFGVIVHAAANDAALQAELRADLALARAGDEVARARVDRAIDELLRIDDPFMKSRRVATCPVSHAGREHAEGTRFVINWHEANRDPVRFGDPDRYAPDEHAPHNLVWGVGAHICPGRELATMELRVLTDELLRAGVLLADAAAPPERNTGGRDGGFRRVPVRLTDSA